MKQNQNLTIGNVETWESTSLGISGKTRIANFSISVFGPDTIRIQVSKEETFYPNPYSVVIGPKHPSFEITQEDGKLHILTSKIHLEIYLYPFHLVFMDTQGEILNADDPAFSISWLGTEITNYKILQQEEKFIGLGEKTGNLNRAGSAYTNWNTDYFAYGIGDDPLYMSIPFYMGLHHNKTYGIYFDNTHKTVFNFGASNNRFAYFSAEDGEMDYYFFHDDSVSKIISAYTELTGRIKLPPIWSLGFQQCRYSYYPETEVLNLGKTFREKDMPADVIYLDIHHMEHYKVFTFDGEKFPDPASMIRRLKEKGFKVVVIMDPGIKAETGYAPYDEGKEQDLFVNYPDGAIYEGKVWPGWCAFPDFTKEETRTWWGEKMKFYKDAGVDGYWTDMNEPASWGQCTPNLLNFHFEGDESSHRKARNVYGFQMARSAMEGSLFQNPLERPFVLTRAGFSGIQRYAAAWTGDNNSTEEHMLAGVRLINSLGLSGVSFCGFDIGGFCGEPSKSLYARWMSIGTFIPLFRAHSMINTNDSEPWSFGEEVEEISRNYMKLRYRLMPMLYSSFYKSTLDGLPIAKSLVVDYAHEPHIYDFAFQNEYLFCENLLIAPVESQKDITKVYLPEGEWYYLYDDRYFTGQQAVYVDAPLNYLPVFVKSGAIMAMQSDVAHTSEEHDGKLRLHVYKGKNKASYLHYEDDGHGFGYEKGDYFKRVIQWNASSQTLEFQAVEGNYASAYSSIQIFFHGSRSEIITMDDQTLNMKKEDIAFLGKLTAFDPLPQNHYPYLEISGVPTVTIPHYKEPFSLQLL